MPKKGRGKSGELDPLSLPNELQTALEALYGHYAKTSALWEEEGIAVPPVFIVVCNNTSTSKLVYDFISGFVRESDGVWVQGRFGLFRNYDEYGSRLPHPRTLLIDSEQLEVGRGNRQDLPRHERRRHRALSAGDRPADRRRSRRRQAHRPGSPARGHEHGRKARPARREYSLRRLGLDADRRLGREYGDPHSRRSCLRHTAVVRAGGRPRFAPAVLRSQRGGPVQPRICRRARYPVRLHREAGGRAADEAAQDCAGRGGTAGTGCAANHLPAGRWISRRIARGTPDREVQP